MPTIRPWPPRPLLVLPALAIDRRPIVDRYVRPTGQAVTCALQQFDFVRGECCHAAQCGRWRLGRGGAFNGNTYNGLRNYIRAMLLVTPSAFDGTADFGGNATSTSYSATYFGDVAHPNALGHSVTASILGPALQTVVNSI